MWRSSVPYGVLLGLALGLLLGSPQVVQPVSYVWRALRSDASFDWTEVGQGRRPRSSASGRRPVPAAARADRS